MIQIQNPALEKMLEHAKQVFPDECCGFLFGTEDREGNRNILEITEVNNSKEGDKRRRFEIGPRDYLRGEQYAVEKDLLLLGVYHSHPNHPAIPSEHDRVAAQPYFSYIIISVMQGNIDHLRSWQLNEENRFEEENTSTIHLHQSI
ncbi:MAG TPA: M67 family metallopeptidase [Puia sp.]|jgi:proteasome lid subunit RPN8/RPN11